MDTKTKKETLRSLGMFIQGGYDMAQLAKRLDKAVKASGKSKSKWVTEVIEKELKDHWPEGFFDLAGS